MLDQVTAVLICEVESQEDGTAFCKVVDLEEAGYDREQSIDTEFWLGVELQLHQEYCHLSMAAFRKRYRTGNRVRVGINIQPLMGKPREAAE